MGDLDVSTNLYLSNYEDLRRQAEKDIMGHVMQDYDWALYTESDQKRYREDIQRLTETSFEKTYLDAMNS